jgi:hypothetical protein
MIDQKKKEINLNDIDLTLDKKTKVLKTSKNNTMCKDISRHLQAFRLSIKSDC